MTGTVSVVIPVLNGLPWLEHQVRSLRTQATELDYEIIVADNGSTDATLEMARRWSHEDGRLRVIDASSRRGAPAARNLGAASGSGEMLLFTDADDICDRRWIDRMYDTLRNADAAGGSLVFIRHDVINAPAVPDELGEPIRRYPYQFLPFAIGTAFGIRSQAFDELNGFREHYHVAEDVDLSWRLQESGLTLRAAPNAVVFKRRRPTRRAAFRQHLQYGAEDTLLFRDHRARGMDRDWRLAIKHWSWLLMTAPRAAASPRHAEAWARVAGMRIGRLRGLIAQRTLYP